MKRPGTQSATEKNLLFKQVYAHITARIDRGEWRAHDKLPSVRVLAQELQVHRLTVFRAYQLLKQSNRAYVKEKSGYYVSPNVTKEGTEWADHAGPGSGSSPLPISSPLHNALSDIQQVPVSYQFSQALIDPNLLPNLFLSEHVKQVFDIYPKLMGTYSGAQGDEELREYLCRYMAKQHGLQLTTDEMLITTGGQQAIDLLARIYLRPMDPVLVERPTYSAALDIFRQQGARLLPVEITRDGYDLDQVEHLMKQFKPRLFYMNPTFHNPTGYTVPAPQRKRLVELAERHRCLLIEDDAIHEMYLKEPPPQPFFAYDTEGWVIYLRSFSKYIAPGLRICAVMGRPMALKPLITAKSLADNGTPLVNQKMFLHYFQSDRMQQHLEKLRIALQIRKEIAEEELRRTGWNWTSPKGGFNLWLQLPPQVPVQELLEECLRQSVSFIPGVICDPLKQMSSCIRLSYSFVNENRLREGIRRLIDIAERLP
ncbi:PLP-dependent aminotransferase family protein [Bacillus sp. 3255]|uniref:aminotransferase-like domain-containing protein n=1 Tax=Bacillus sp. 3255 TaxID=2817904 RepID=UPI00285538CC|nr:PLP-dependent aminotransferase family protein [Bacillus sp. 3255]MDR6881126.1 DNA-binding transcriptional MocR family regulator [Bacillus sp. 3255]